MIIIVKYTSTGNGGEPPSTGGFGGTMELTPMFRKRSKFYFFVSKCRLILTSISYLKSFLTDEFMGWFHLVLGFSLLFCNFSGFISRYRRLWLVPFLASVMTFAAAIWTFCFSKCSAFWETIIQVVSVCKSEILMIIVSFRVPLKNCHK